MRKSFRIRVLVLILGGFSTATAFAITPKETEGNVPKGKAVYNRACIFCHGASGEGDGPAAFFIASYSAPRPRDFTTGTYKFRTTSSGELPTDQDLFRTVTNGIPGYMPPFLGLSEEERWNVIAYVKTFSTAFKLETPKVLSIENPNIPPTLESIEKGRDLYFRYGCQECHGVSAHGDGPLAEVGGLKDDLDLSITPRDLTQPMSFKNGSTPKDIFRSIMTGLDGTPMPSYAPQTEGNKEDLWHLVNYILSLSFHSNIRFSNQGFAPS